MSPIWPVTQQWLDTLTRSHGISVTVDALRGGVRLGSVPFERATVRVTATNRVRRTLELTTAEELYPADATDLLSPFGTELLINYSITGVDGQPIGPAVPVFLGGIDNPDALRMSGQLTLTASDRMTDINAARFLAPRVAPLGTKVADVIRGLLYEVIPEAGVTDTTGATATAPSGVMWARDRGAAIDELAGSIGAEVVALPDGSFLIRAVPTLANAPVWRLATGDNGVIVSDRRSLSRADVRNAWVITGERADGSDAILATVYDLDPESPTRWNGPLRQRPGFWSSPLVSTPDQGIIVGKAKLARSLGAARTREIVAAPNPALDAGDVIAVATEDGTEAHIVDEISLGLTPESAAMSIGSRSAEEPGE